MERRLIPKPCPFAAMKKDPAVLMEVARSTWLLRIEGFSSMPTTTIGGVDQFVETTRSIYGYDCQVRFYPSMKVTKHSLFDARLAVELVLPTTTSEGEAHIGLKLSCRLVDPRGKLEPSRGGGASGVSGPSQQKIGVFLIARSELAGSGYLKHDSITIECSIMLSMRSSGMTVLPVKQQAPVQSSNLNLDLAQLQQSKTGADVTFLVSGESIAAHKLILAARSLVFSAEFYGHFGEKSAQEIQVEGIEAAAFKAMLNFIYTDAVPELDQQSEDVTALAQHLFAAADRYALNGLKLICEAKLSGSIKVETAASTLAFAEEHNSSRLKAKCIEFIVSTPDVLDDVLATDAYTHLVASHPSVLRDLLTSARGRKRPKHDLMVPTLRF